MTRSVFFVPSDVLLNSSTIVVDGAEGRHGAAARRLRVGEDVRLTDGVGNLADGQVSAVDSNAFTVEADRREAVARPEPSIVVVQALPKGAHSDLAISLLTQTGVDQIVPWSAERCVVRWQGDRAARGLAKWRSVANEAAKQSRRVWWPQVSGLMSTAEVCQRLASTAVAVVLHESSESGLAEVVPPVRGEIVLIVGPEGGISDAELRAFEAAGAQRAQAGPTVMRTSSAGAMAAAVLSSKTMRWST